MQNLYKRQSLLAKALLFICFGLLFASCSTNDENSDRTQPISKNQNGTTAFDTQPNQDEKEIHLIPFKVKYTFTNARADKKPYFLILIHPVNLKTDSFKTDIKLIVNEFIKKYGREISIDVFDNDQVLQLVSRSSIIDIYNGIDLNSSQYFKRLALHNIATYDGEIFTDRDGNAESSQYTLDFFPDATYNVTEVAGYIETINL